MKKLPILAIAVVLVLVLSNGTFGVMTNRMARPKETPNDSKGNSGSPMFRGNPAHTGYYPGGLGKRKAGQSDAQTLVFVGSYDSYLHAVDAVSGKGVWKAKTAEKPLSKWGSPGWLLSSPAVVDGIVFVGGVDQHLHALEAKTGDEVWKFKTESPICSSPAIADGMVCVGSQDHNLYAFEAKTGKLLWKAQTGGPVNSSPAIAQAQVYVGSYDGYLYAFNSKTGKEIWKYKTERKNTVHCKIVSSPLVCTSKGVVYVGSFDEHLHAINTTTGKMIWKYKAGAYINCSPALFQDKIYVCAAESNYHAQMTALDPKGQPIWQTVLKEIRLTVYASPAISDGKIYMACKDKHVYSLDALTGKKLWATPVDARITSSPAVWNDRVFVGSADENLYAFEAKTGKVIWKYKSGGIINSSPAVATDHK